MCFVSPGKLPSLQGRVSLQQAEEGLGAAESWACSPRAGAARLPGAEVDVGLGSAQGSVFQEQGRDGLSLASSWCVLVCVCVYMYVCACTCELGAGEEYGCYCL